MSIQKLSRTGLWSDLETGSSGWGPKRNYNSNRLDQLVASSIIGQVATSTALPALPNNGDMYFVQDTMKLASYILGSWFQDFTPIVVYDSTLDAFYYFDGTALITPLP